MIQKKPYFRPLIESIELDTNISIVMTTPETPPNPPQPGQASTSSFKEEEDNSGFNEDPFKR